MPFSLSDVTKYNSKLTTQAQKEQWVAIANSILEDCEGKGCDAQAIRTANGVLAKQKAMPPGFRKSDSKYSCANCQYFNLEYCTLYDVLVKQDDMCDMWMPQFKYGYKVPKKYAHINFKPPKSVQDIAKRALNKIDLAGDGLEQQTKIWARKVANGEPITPDKARQGYRWFARNKRFKNAEKDSPAWISWLFWFGEPGQSWFSKLWQQMEAADKKEG